MLDRAKTLEPTQHLPESPSSPAYEITHLKLIESCMHVISTESCCLHISGIKRDSGIWELFATGYVNSKSAKVSWKMGEEEWRVLVEDRSKTIPKWKLVQLQRRHLVVQHPNVQGHLSARVAKSIEGKQRFAVQKVSLEVSADTHIHVRVFKLLGFLITFQFFFFLHLHGIERTRTFKE